MILPYFLRLVCLSLACFFLIHLVLGLGISALAPLTLNRVKRLKPGSAAGLLLAARLFPSVAAVLVVAGICVPSYLWLEPDAAVEQVGLVCLAAAIVSVVNLAASMWRGSRAIVLSMRYNRRTGGEARTLGEEIPVVWMDQGAGLIALAGIFRPRLVVSREVARELSADQLAVALLHERAHWSSRDNLKRLLMLLAPDALPFRFRFFAGLEALERGWVRFTEWSADDRAVCGDPHRSLALAGALVRVARLGNRSAISPLMTSLMADASDLEARVERLLAGALGGERLRWRMAAILVLTAAVVAVWTAPATLQAAHELLEQLIR